MGPEQYHNLREIMVMENIRGSESAWKMKME